MNVNSFSASFVAIAGEGYRARIENPKEKLKNLREETNEIKERVAQPKQAHEKVGQITDEAMEIGGKAYPSSK